MQGQTPQPQRGGPLGEQVSHPEGRSSDCASHASNVRCMSLPDGEPLHQQKSTFLIPSYSILLHLIPLILRVRRE